jgi:hypothetical protein
MHACMHAGYPSCQLASTLAERGGAGHAGHQRAISVQFTLVGVRGRVT